MVPCHRLSAAATDTLALNHVIGLTTLGSRGIFLIHGRILLRFLLQLHSLNRRYEAVFPLMKVLEIKQTV
jgi:hypothetical protein